jgi:hypothetical protein
MTGQEDKTNYFRVELKNIQWDIDCDNPLRMTFVDTSATTIVEAENEEQAVDFAMDEISSDYGWCILDCNVKIETVIPEYRGV